MPMAASAAAVLFVAVMAGLAVGWLNQPWFDMANRLLPVEGAEARGLLFSSWLLLIGVPIVARRPQRYGFTRGSMAAHRWLIAGTVVAGAVATWVILAVTGPNPYSDASWFIEVVDVPFTEELVFRAVLLTLLLAVLGRIAPPRVAVPLAVLFDGIAFGIAHTANATDLELGFVLAQATFATVLGVGCATLQVRTRSVYPAMLLHSAVNATVILA
jgi:membrane protease YdiL (CAAX protease family)